MPRSPPPDRAAASPPPSKAKRRFDIESLLAKPEPPRRESPLPGAWAAASPSPPALRFGCLAATLRFPALYLAAQQPFLSAPICRCAAPACQRPAAEPDFSRCTASLAPAPPWRPGAPCRMKRVRTVFTAEQLERLEGEFLRQQYMVGSERLDLAAALQLSETQVKVWFQNRRIKWRKQSLEQKAAKLSSQFGTDPLAPSGPPDGQGSPQGEEEEEEDLKVDL